MSALCVCPQLLLLVFICLSICKRDKLIPLQFVVLGVIVMGAAETTTWFIAYLSKNSSGVGPCGVDGICPPLTADMMVALVLNVGKRTLSRVLLLVVVLGYGVVESTLGFARTGCVVLLGCVRLNASFSCVRRPPPTQVGSSGISMFLTYLTTIAQGAVLCLWRG